MSKAIKTLAVTTAIFAASASLAFAQSPPPYGGSYSYGYPGEGNLPAFLIAPYGYANPSYTGDYGTYPAQNWDPDPYLRARLRAVERVDLQWSQIDLDNARLHLRGSRTESERVPAQAR
jgi:hypothetical protein